MNLIRLKRHQHPKPPHHELRQKQVLDSGSRSVGQVANLYVDEDRADRLINPATYSCHNDEREYAAEWLLYGVRVGEENLLKLGSLSS
jgi:hypothetical protein